MNDSLTALTWLHLFFVIAWFGSFLYTFLVLFPVFPKLTPQSNKEFLFKLLPSHEFFTILFSTGAVVAGGLLFLEIGHGQSDAWFSYMWIGIIFGLIAYVLVLIAVFTMRKMYKALGSIINQPNVAMPPPPKSVIALAAASFVTLIFAMSFMVLAASL